MTKEVFNEIQILQSCAAGDTAAFGMIVRKYQALICAITYSAVGQVDKSEEIAQQAFINAWKNLNQLQDLDKFKAWLIGITRNVIRTFYRTQKRDIVNNAAAIDQIGDIADHSSEPLEAIIAKEQEAIVQQSLHRIPELYREPMVLFYRQQQSTRQVAESLDLTEETVRTRLMRGRKMLKEQVAAMVESTLSHTGPGKAFTAMVVASIAGLALTSATASAATASATASSAGSSGLAALTTGITAKIITAAAVVAVGIGAVFAYKHLSKPESPSTESYEIIAAEDAQQPVTFPESTETLQPEVSDIVDADPIETSETQIATLPNNLTVTDIPETESASISQTTGIPEPAEYVFEPNGVLSGLVTDAKTGDPVTDATVEISISRVYTTKTDENGFYSFKKVNQSGNYCVGVSSIEYVGITDYNKKPKINLVKNSQEVKHFQLQKACMLDVWVVDEKGMAVKDARVYTTSLADDRSREIGDSMHSRKTDKNGYILLGGFPPSASPYLITVVHNREKTISKNKGIRYVESTPNYAYAGKQVTLNDPEMIPSVEITLKKGTSVKGYAEYLDGVPAEGLGIRVYPDWWHCNSCPTAWPIEPNGFFTLDQIIPGTYNLQISIPTGEGSSMGKHLFSTHLPLPEGALLKVTVPEKSPESLVSICGSVKFNGEKKPDSVWINAYSREHGHQSTNLDRDMRGNLKTSFCIDRLEPGTYRLQFEGSEIEPVTMENVEAPCDDIEVELFAVGKPRLAGTVMDADFDEPITRFKVRAKKLGTLRGPNYVQQNQWTDFRNENGEFETEAVGPGLYQVQVIAEGYAPQWSPEINTDNNTAQLIKLNKGGTVTGTVIDFEGRIVQNATIIPLSVAGGTGSKTQDIFVSADGAVQTNSKGQFTLSCLAEGNETLKVTHPDYADEIVKEIPVQLNQTTETQPIVLGKGAAIEGFVFDGFGKSESGVTLYVQDDNGYSGTNDEIAGRLATVITDPNGFYRVDNLPETMCYLRRQNGGTSLGVARRTVMPKNGKTSQIDFGGKFKLTGQVIINGQLLANTRIQLAPQGQPNFGVFQAFAVTDTNGNFCLYPGIVGRCALYYKEVQSHDWTELAVVTLPADGDVDVGIIPEKTSTLRVYVNQPDAGPEWQIEYMFVQKGDNPTSPRTAAASPPKKPDDPYIVPNLLPGSYTINLYRSDMLIYKVPLEVKENEPELDLVLDLPVSNSTLVVDTIGDIQYLILSSDDEHLQKTLRPDSEGKLKAENLPAGRYHLLNGMVAMKQTILETFDLHAGQTKTLDISQQTITPEMISSLQVEIVDENGTPITDCNVWLEGRDGKVESFMQYSFTTAFTTSPGKYTLHTARPGYKDVNKAVTLEAIDMENLSNQKHQKILLRLEPE